MRRVSILIVLVFGCFIESKAQKAALKSNLLYDATTTVNLGLGFGLAYKWTLDVPVNCSPWKSDNGRRLRHWGIQPEVRCWLCERFRCMFIGVHGHYADFNVGGFPDWSFISENIQNSRYQGYLYDGGVPVGHSWILKRRWSIEASVGVGYAHIVYDKYPYRACGTKLKDSSKNCFSPTKASVSLIYIVK